MFAIFSLNKFSALRRSACSLSEGCLDTQMVFATCELKRIQYTREKKLRAKRENPLAKLAAHMLIHRLIQCVSKFPEAVKFMTNI